jgi:hypothetical protein
MLDKAVAESVQLPEKERSDKRPNYLRRNLIYDASKKKENG